MLHRYNSLFLALFCLCVDACAFVPLVDDYGQCQRHCQATIGRHSVGWRDGVFATTCTCSTPEHSFVHIDRLFTADRDDSNAFECSEDGRSLKIDPQRDPEIRIAHAGRCGACSAPRDRRVLWKTKHNLTKRATRCAAFYVFTGRDVAAQCVDKIGFTPTCRDCWLDNMACTIVHCGQVCAFSRLRNETNSVDGTLNTCLACDETYCGAPFARCAGANRRRSGIISDIQRQSDEVWQR